MSVLQLQNQRWGTSPNNNASLYFDNLSVSTVPSPACIADLTGDGELNFFDVSEFLDLFQLGDPIADFTGDGEFNFFDVSAFLNAFIDGCP